MTIYYRFVTRLALWRDTRGQDLIEYALVAAFVAVAAGAISPGFSAGISTLYSKMASVMVKAAAS